MVSNKWTKVSSPLATTCLIAMSVAFTIDGVLTIIAASSYPYLIAYTSELYVSKSTNITIVYSIIGVAAFLLSLSTVWAFHKYKNNYLLVHACITAIFLPALLLVYFSSDTHRYKDSELLGKEMIEEYKMASKQIRTSGQASHVASSSSSSQSEDIESNHEKADIEPFINIIDSIQRKFDCCGIKSYNDWVQHWNGYIPPSCCDLDKKEVKTNQTWAKSFGVEENQEFEFCSETSAHRLGCLTALKDDEKSKYAWLADLCFFLMFITITNTIASLLLFGLGKTEDMTREMDEYELAMVGVSSKPRPSQPDLTGIRHRPSVVALGVNKERIASLSQAVRFNVSNSPRASISGSSKFSAGARRDSVIRSGP